MFRKARLTLPVLAAFFILMAVVAVTVEAGNPGMVSVVVGGGSLNEALFASAQSADATFSLSAGYDKHGITKGHFFFKRVYPGAGVRAVVSTEITSLDVGFDAGYGCPWARIEGVMTLHATWVNKPIRGEYFAVEVWDCEGVDYAPDMIWFGVYRDQVGGNDRPALTLSEPAFLGGGNIMIH